MPTSDPQLYHIAIHAKDTPCRRALVMAGSGETTTYGELDQRSRRLARYFSKCGIRSGDHVAIMMDNSPDYFIVCWAAQRLGLTYTPINWHLAADEVSYIIQNCEAKILVISDNVRPVIETLAKECLAVDLFLTRGPAFGNFVNLDRAIDETEDGPDVALVEGRCMFYSSGTTGRPKGIMTAATDLRWGEETPLSRLLRTFYGFGRDTVYLVPAPLYHAAGLGWSMNVLRAGGAVVIMSKFDPAETLQFIDQHRVTHAQFVPTMFVRMLRLPASERMRYHLSSLKVAIHAAAPCPADVKRQMIDWFGPIIYEYYAGSEANGITAVDTPQWLARPGTVGRPVFGQVHIVGDDGRVLPAGQDGTIYFSGGSQFEYFKDPDKTRATYNDLGWSTLGDIGHVDEDGFLYLSDRRTDLIISGGVNIYPREIEDVLIQHPAVLDVAVIGVPSAEFGHDVKALIELKAGIVAHSDLTADLTSFCRNRMAGYKCPKSFDFGVLPRLPNGKMLRRELRERYSAPDRLQTTSRAQHLPNAAIS